MKKFKIHSNNYVELLLNVTEEENFSKFIEIMKLFKLNPQTSICTCSYDRDFINLIIIEGEVKVKVIEKKKKFFRSIYLKETKIEINSIEIIKSLLRTSKDYDVILTITSTNESNENTIIVVNDNGHNYIIYDKNKYDGKEIKIKINKILNY